MIRSTNAADLRLSSALRLDHRSHAMPNLSANHLAAGIEPWIACESPSSSPEASRTWSGSLRSKHAPRGSRRHQRDRRQDRTAAARHEPRRGRCAPGHPRPRPPRHRASVRSLQQNPCRIEGDRMYGPGMYDMKAGIYLALTALGELKGATRCPSTSCCARRRDRQSRSRPRSSASPPIRATRWSASRRAPSAACA